MQDVRFRMGEGIPGAIGQCQEGMIVNDYQASPYANQLFIEHTGITAVLASPLLYHGRLLGVIALNNGRREGISLSRMAISSACSLLRLRSLSGMSTFIPKPPGGSEKPR